jgi:tetratricopeptide (TPR) repeat protein
MKKFLRDLDGDVKKGNVVIPVLKEKLQEYANRSDREWEYAQVAIALGRLHLDVPDGGHPAQEYFESAIDKLSKKHRLEIKLLGLRALEAVSLNRQEKHAEALQKAEQAIYLDPLRPFERKKLGEVYSGLNDFESARAAWEGALLQNPSDPEIHANIGISYLKSSVDYRDSTQRMVAVRQATRYLGQALELYRSDQPEAKAWVHHWLGRLYYMSRSPEKAISQFRIAQARTTTNEKLVVTVFLGAAYLETKAYDECEKQFHWIIEETKKKLAAGEKASTIIGTKIGNPVPLGQVYAYAFLYLALSYAERDTNLGKALGLVDEASKYINELSDESAKAHSRAAQFDCRGWILYKQKDMKGAVESLEEAVALSAEAEAYWHLAMAYEGQIQGCEDKKERQHLIACAQAHCQHAQEIDVDQKYSQRIKDLLLHIQREEQPDRGTEEQRQPKK